MRICHCPGQRPVVTDDESILHQTGTGAKTAQILTAGAQPEEQASTILGDVQPSGVACRVNEFDMDALSATSTRTSTLGSNDAMSRARSSAEHTPHGAAGRPPTVLPESIAHSADASRFEFSRSVGAEWSNLELGKHPHQ